MKVISASRRTDIPGLYSEWFMNRIKAGYSEWINPFGGKVLRASLKPEDVLAIVFWTRNPAPMFPHIPTLKDLGYKYYFQVTINGYPRPLEERSPNMEGAVTQFRKLSDIISPEFVQWRYDPIIINDRTPFSWHLDRFQYLCEKLHHATKRCYFSFVSWYGKTKRNFQRLKAEEDILFIEPTLKDKQKFLASMTRIAKSHKITLYSCCDDIILGNGIEKAHCVDLEILRALRPELNFSLSLKPTRKDCGCFESSDIGAYDTCTFGCSYCYATNSPDLAQQRFQAHNPLDSLLFRPPHLGENA